MIAEAGDRRLVTLLRSSAKPFQALPLARAFDDSTTRELAIASASHLARPRAARRSSHAARACARRRARPRVRPARAIRRRGSSTTAPASTPGCSPCAARTAGPREGYRLASHPMQRQNLRDVADAAGIDRGRTRRPRSTAAASSRSRSTLERMATMFTRLEALARGQARRRRDARAPRADPRPGRDRHGAHAARSRARSRRAAPKGLLCGVLPDGTGFALKCADGARGRSVRPLAAFLATPRRSSCRDFAELPLDEQPRRARRHDRRRVSRTENRCGNFVRRRVISGACEGEPEALGFVDRLLCVRSSDPEPVGVHVARTAGRSLLADGRHLSARRRGAAQARPGRPGEGIPHL